MLSFPSPPSAAVVVDGEGLGPDRLLQKHTCAYLISDTATPTLNSEGYGLHPCSVSAPLL